MPVLRLAWLPSPACRGATAWTNHPHEFGHAAGRLDAATFELLIFLDIKMSSQKKNEPHPLGRLPGIGLSVRFPFQITRVVSEIVDFRLFPETFG